MRCGWIRQLPVQSWLVPTTPTAGSQWSQPHLPYGGGISTLPPLDKDSGRRCPHRPGQRFGTATKTSPPRSLCVQCHDAPLRGLAAFPCRDCPLCRPAGAKDPWETRVPRLTPWATICRHSAPEGARLDDLPSRRSPRLGVRQVSDSSAFSTSPRETPASPRRGPSPTLSPWPSSHRSR